MVGYRGSVNLFEFVRNGLLPVAYSVGPTAIRYQHLVELVRLN